MNFNISDLIRSIVIGQTVVMGSLMAIHTSLTIAWRRPRAGSATGLVMLAISHVTVSIFVVLVMIDRINTDGLGWLTGIAVIYVSTGNLGVCLLTASVVLHNDHMRERIKHWLGNK